MRYENISRLSRAIHVNERLGAALLCGVLGIAVGSTGHAADAAASAEATSSAEMTEITVTATRREESLSKVPISISAFTQETMDQKGVKDISDLVRYTPGVSIDQTGTNAISIRGISSSGGAGTTGIYIDDTPIQMRSLGFNPDDTLPKTFDLDRVEVLRGPQGTLFGAGSEGGTVRYILTQPSVTKDSTYVKSEVSFTQYGEPSYEAGIASRRPDHRRRLRLSRQRLVPQGRRLDRSGRSHDPRRRRQECQHRRVFGVAPGSPLAAGERGADHAEHLLSASPGARRFNLLARVLGSGCGAFQQCQSRQKSRCPTSSTCRR